MTTGRVPTASANVVGSPRVCPQCHEECDIAYGVMGSNKPLVCGRCYDGQRP